LELGRLETITVLNLLKEWFVENEPNEGQIMVLKEEPHDESHEAETEQNVDMANL